ncbi:superoxide dismutase family protein [Maribacter algarum]|uniref:Superoxide dismutase family protein n=1 Tax=Maribacter algarum (ex Zhang et al. 2020) TaxID=2578118 RepID=A0A5S3PVA1_9FLAO|nr:superoxide dismutase family protein [Maribacter algarum]TMM56878.1 superoxide dismutase family protein [Maribacter algarum]
MKKIKIAVMGFLMITSFNCKDVKKEADKAADTMEEAADEMKEAAKEVTEEVNTVKFMMEPKSDSNVKGTVTFTEADGKVSMIAMLSGLSAGEHAIHIHDKADCSSADGKSTGGHWNPTNTPHGKWGAAEGYHKGDIGNFTADEAGLATVEFSTEEWCIGCDDETKNILGKGVIVHQGVDDFTSQPSGAAGARVSCTGIIQ